jgi:hypothetical protein
MRKALTITVLAAALGLGGPGSDQPDEQTATKPTVTSAEPAKPDPAPAGVSAEPGGTVAPRVVPNYPTNDSGLTYGSVELANSPQDEPDLILVETQTGLTGYVKKAELNRATGGNVSNPQEALAWQARVDIGLPSFIPVYAQDGVTIVGEFEIAPSERPILN